MDIKKFLNQTVTNEKSIEWLKKILPIWGVVQIVLAILGVAYMQYFYATARVSEGEVASVLDYFDYSTAGTRRSRFIEEIANPRLLVETLTSFGGELHYPKIIFNDPEKGDFALDAKKVATKKENQWNTGEKIQVYYDPANPLGTARLRSYDYEWAEPVFNLIMGALILYVGIRAQKVGLRWERK